MWVCDGAGKQSRVKARQKAKSKNKNEKAKKQKGQKQSIKQQCNRKTKSPLKIRLVHPRASKFQYELSCQAHRTGSQASPQTHTRSSLYREYIHISIDRRSPDRIRIEANRCGSQLAPYPSDYISNAGRSHADSQLNVMPSDKTNNNKLIIKIWYQNNWKTENWNNNHHQLVICWLCFGS